MKNTLISDALNKGAKRPYLRLLASEGLPIVCSNDCKGAMSNKFSNPIRLLRTALGLVLAGFFAMGAHSQVPAPDGGGAPEFLESTQRWLDQAVSSAGAAAGQHALRMEVAVGELDRRLRLAPCARIEPYIPAGTRLWGKTRLGLRCLEGSAKWNVFLPVTIKAYGPAWVIRDQVAPGAVLTAADAVEAEVDWAEQASPIVSQPSQWVGQVASRTLTSGQALRQAMIRPAQVFQAGTQIRVVAQGPGFQIVSAGQAMSAGVIGLPARVRMDNGRVMSGLVLDNRTVKLDI